MGNRAILKLVAGFKKFRESTFVREGSIYSRLNEGQAPKTLIIGCSDSRVDPAIIWNANPGEIFVVRNVANLVPPFDATKSGLHGVSAAIEFAVVDLKVENVIIFGHRLCGGIRALVSGEVRGDSFLGPWLQIAKPAKEAVLAAHPEADLDSLCRHCELESITTSIANLRSFPFVQEAIRTRDLSILGVYFDIEKGELSEYDEQANSFKLIP